MHLWSLINLHVRSLIAYSVGKDIYPAYSCTLNSHFRQYFKKCYNCNAIITYFKYHILIPYIIKKSPNIKTLKYKSYN